MSGRVSVRRSWDVWVMGDRAGREVWYFVWALEVVVRELMWYVRQEGEGLVTSIMGEGEKRWVYIWLRSSGGRVRRGDVELGNMNVILGI
jgi:hypothetical protein